MSDQDIIRKRIQVYGSVQGVGFRYRTRYAAELQGVTGWVENLDDGSVLMELQGTEEQIDKVFETVVQSGWINVTDMKVQKIDVEESRGFHTR